MWLYLLTLFSYQIRWRHELSQFSGLQVLTFGLTGGITNPKNEDDVKSLSPSDVIICEYGAVIQVQDVLTEMKAVLHSVTVDFRHTLALRSTMGISSFEIEKPQRDFPTELLSNEWWDTLITLVQSEETRSLFVEYSDADPFSLSKSGLGDKQQLVVLAKRAACVLGPDIFYSPTHSVHRQILGWARKTGKNSIGEKLARVKKNISDAVGPLCYTVKKAMMLSSDFEWNLRSCSMTSFQREEYERCCSEVRGSLSSFLVDVDKGSTSFDESLSAASRSLFRLRQYCFHPRSKEILARIGLRYSLNGKLAESKSSSSWGEIIRKSWNNSASQPDARTAKSLLDGAAKLKELLSILVTEAGLEVTSEESIESLQLGSESEDEEAYDGDKPKKVAIIAVLPEVQILVSVLLNSLGIQNTLLYGKTRDATKTVDSVLDGSDQVGLSWFDSQSILSKFCKEDEGTDENAKLCPNVVVVSPSSFEAGCNGLGLEGADIIVTLDSDWTGRDGYIIDSLIKRWLARNELYDKEGQLIRLVCDNSVETNLFADNEMSIEKSSWPLDSDGYLTLPQSEEEAAKLYKNAVNNPNSSFFAFPAVHLLRERGNLLSDVLATDSPLPPLLGSGGLVKFLPRRSSKSDNAEQELLSELHFVQHFLRFEQVISTGGSIPGTSRNFTDTISSQQSLTKQFSSGLMTRQDLPSIGVFLYLEQLATSHSLLQIHGDDGSSKRMLQLTDLSAGDFGSGENAGPGVEENPLSLLMYEPRREDASRVELSSTHDEGFKYLKADTGLKRRHNAYAKLFSSRWDGFSIQDGNQGSEPLVFFPPLFPLLEQSSKRARLEEYAARPAHATHHAETTASDANCPKEET